jgi:hypothetical protein
MRLSLLWFLLLCSIVGCSEDSRSTLRNDFGSFERPSVRARRASVIRAAQSNASSRFAWVPSADASLQAGGSGAAYSLVGRELRVQPVERAWTLRVLTTGWGRGARQHAEQPTAAPVMGPANVATSTSGGIAEQWTHGPLGVEHVYQLTERLPGHGELWVELAMAGLEPRQVDERTVGLVGPNGALQARYAELFVYDAEERELPARFEVSGSRVRIRVDDHGARYPIVIDPLVTVAEATLETPGWAVTGELGASIAMSADGTRVLVGAPAADPVAGQAGGTTLVFRWSGTHWEVEAVLQGAGVRSGDRCGQAVALSADGSRAVVGCVEGDYSGVRLGRAHVFARVGSTWTEEAVLMDSAGAAVDLFGAAVAISGDGSRIVVGAPAHSTAGLWYSGRAVVFARIGSTWSHEAALSARVPAEHARFGRSVAIDATGNRVLVGGPGDGGSGTVRVFDRSGTTWTERAELRPWPLTTGLRFGQSVALTPAGTVVLVGAPGDGPSGSARVFRWTGAAWVEEAALTASDPITLAGLGMAVAVSDDGTRALIGASGYMTSTSAPRIGAAYVYRRVDGIWVQESRLNAFDRLTEDRFGASVALSSDGSVGVVGVPGDDTAVDRDGGSARVFRRAGAVWTEDATLVDSEGLVSYAFFGRSVAMDADATRTVIGAPGDHVGGPNAGGARVFVRAGPGWIEEAAFASSRYEEQGSVGESVSMSADGSRVAVGAPNRGGVSGRASVFVRSGTRWAEEVLLTRPSSSYAAHFGSSVSLSADGSRLLVGGGQLPERTHLSERGVAFVYVRSGSSWSLETSLGSSELGYGYASALSADGTRAIVGAYLSGGTIRVGSALVFARSGSTWVHEATLRAPDGAHYDIFGASVAITADGSRVLVAAPWDSTSAGEQAGTVRVFVRSGTTWREEALLVPAGPAGVRGFGRQLAISSDGTRALVSDMSELGLVWVFVRSGTIWSEQGTISASPMSWAAEWGRPVALTTDGGRAVVGSPWEHGAALHTGTARMFALSYDVGVPCASSSVCASGHCVDGVCCEDACGDGFDDCRACSVAAGGTVDGACTPLTPARAALRVCRPAAGACDAPESCSPALTECPPDMLLSGTPCRGSAGPCDSAEMCTGDTVDCPPDQFSKGAECRPALGPCDIAEVCTGSMAECPPNAFASEVECRPATCDDGNASLPVMCSGAAAECPAPMTDACSPYACGTSECLSSCASDTHCAPGYRCAGGECVPPALDGGLPEPGVDGGALAPLDAGVPMDAHDGALDDGGAQIDAGSVASMSGGCGCRVSSQNAGASVGVLGVSLTLITWARRRRRKTTLDS